MPKISKPAGSAWFCGAVGSVTEIKSGFLLKSPPPKQFKTEKSWKKRYFVLYKVGKQDYQLKYSKSPEEKDKVHGEIDLLQISQMYLSPERNPRWEWIQRTFKCSSSCVLCIKVADRDFFLIGEDSTEVDSWFSVLFNALKNRPHNITPAECLDGSHSIMVISKPISMDQTCATNEKGRSFSDPSSSTLEIDSVKTKREDFSRRRASVPMNSDYDYPRPRPLTMQKAASQGSLDGIYEPMDLKRLEEGDEKRVSDYSSGSSDNGAVSPTLDKQSSTESLDSPNPEERDIRVKQADMKKHLTVTEVDGRPTVSGWTGQPQSQCLFHKGDQVLAINDLHTGSLDEFNMYLSRSLKNEVKVTILRQHGCQPLHLPTGVCSS